MPEPRPLVAIERIGQRYLLVGRGEQCLLNRGQPFHLFIELRQLFLKPCLGQQRRFRRAFSCRSPAVGGVELAHLARHALFDLLHAGIVEKARLRLDDQ